MVTREYFKKVAHGIICILRFNVLVVWQSSFVALPMSLLVGEAPSFEVLTAWMFKANFEQMVVDISLQLHFFLVPGPLAPDIYLGEMDLNT